MATESLYMYSAGRIKALENTLLSEVNVERLLGAKENEEFMRVLHDTFLSPYISDRKEVHLSRAFRKCITNTKMLLASIAPEPELLEILWVQYDYHNLKTILKGKRANLDDAEITENCYKAGRYDIRSMIRAIGGDNLSFASMTMRSAYYEAREAKELYEVDTIMNKAYFREIHEMAQAFDNSFIREFVTLIIDLFNIRTRLRVLDLDGRGLGRVGDVFVGGGSLQREQLEKKEDIYEALQRYGGEKVWKEPWREYEEEGHYTMIERAADNAVVKFLKEKSMQMFSVALLFAFFWARKNNVELIKTIHVGKNAGLSEGALRKMLRRVYS